MFSSTLEVFSKSKKPLIKDEIHPISEENHQFTYFQPNNVESFESIADNFRQFIDEAVFVRELILFFCIFFA